MEDRVSVSASPPAKKRRRQQEQEQEQEQSEDAASSSSRSSSSSSTSGYFSLYSDSRIHQDMLRDESRTLAYREAILRNKAAFEGRAVLDIGCGTGILSLFAVEAGARVVYAVEASDMALQARAIVKANECDDRICVLQCRAEEVELPERVDVLISEWMGYFLLYETMLPSVIAARDRWLKPNGLVLPSHARLYMSPFTAPDVVRERVGFWTEDVYGYSMGSMAARARRELAREPLSLGLTPENDLALQPVCVKRINCATVTSADVAEWTFDETVSVTCTQHAEMHGWAGWFDVVFDVRGGTDGHGNDGTVLLSTAPDAPATHWGQVAFFSPAASSVEQGDAITLPRVSVRMLADRRTIVTIGGDAEYILR